MKKIIAIVGPTASGKTSLGILLAKQFNGEVISVDSRQIFKKMDIGTAKPEGEWKEERIEKGSIHQIFGGRKHLDVEGVSHWGINLVEPDHDYSVANFKGYADKKIDEITKRGHLPILVGGTGLWMQAVIDNLSLTEVPPDPELRAALELRPAHDLYGEYKQLDPKGAETIDKQNKRRLIRALEVTKITGRPFSKQMTKGEPQYEVLQIGLEVDREELNERINDRVDEMIGMGLVDEVRSLKEEYGCNIQSMTGIGYRQICRFLDGDVKLNEAIEDLKKDTRHFAKRQMTWFKRDDRIHWVTESKKAVELVEAFLT